MNVDFDGILDTRNDARRLRMLIHILATARPEERLALLQALDTEVKTADARERDFQISVSEYVKSKRKAG